MRLYEVKDVGEELVYVPTDETFPSTRAFAAKVKVDGSAYQGKSWVILPEGKGEPKVMTVARVEQFEIKLED